jgi:peptide/nickel transport system permease protein
MEVSATLKSAELDRRTLTRPWGLYLGAAVAVVMILLAIGGEAIAPYGPDQIDPAAQLQPPSSAHLFGTDQNGMDVFSRVIIAPRYDVLIGVAGAALAALIGVAVGIAAGYLGRGAVALIRLTDVFQAFPVFILAMAIVVFLGQSLVNIILVVGIINAPVYARVSHAQAVRLREANFARSAIVSGIPQWRVLVQHIFPNSLGPIVSQFSATIGFAILLTAGLSFVGAGIRPPTPEWGSMIALGTSNMVSGEWWPTVFPGLALAATTFGFAAVGELMGRRLGVTAV